MFVPFSLPKVELTDLYLAYKKAKSEAFYENTHFHALAFAKYEEKLDKNLSLLKELLADESYEWCFDAGFVGDYAYLPKSVSCGAWDGANDSHFRALDPRVDWQNRFNGSGVRADANLRLVIRPTVDFQIVSALWVIHIGHLFDYSLDRNLSYGNRLRRAKLNSGDVRSSGSGVNGTVPSLFTPYFSAYREWRERGLKAMENELQRKRSVVGITMDIERFYHRVAPEFLLRPEFLRSIGLHLNKCECDFTAALLSAISYWYQGTPDYSLRPQGAIPVGLSASKIISNILLHQFDSSVAKGLRPLYFGRYVDDVFLVLSSKGLDDLEAVTERIRNSLGPLADRRRKSDAMSTLRLKLPYAKDSELIFAGTKQKIFSLTAKHGMDLIHHIRDQIRVQSSEHRLLPAVPNNEVSMVAKALLATPNATLQVDALRKADVVSVKRLGFSLLLSDIETYALDLKPNTWKNLREEFYGLVSRHIVTPHGFFDYFGYIHRVFGLMISCGDVAEARSLIKDIRRVSNLLLRTTTLGEGERNRWCYSLCMEQYAAALLQAAIQAATARGAASWTGLMLIIRDIGAISREIEAPKSIIGIKSLARSVLLSDWGRRPYKDYWFQGQNADEGGPPLPSDFGIRRQLVEIRRFRIGATDLPVPHWPALVFPTRPLRIDEIVLIAPSVLCDESMLRRAIMALRGARVVTSRSIGFRANPVGGLRFFDVHGKKKGAIRIAVTSVETTQAQWVAAVQGTQDRSLERYVGLNTLLNRILGASKRPDYIVLPELAVPLKWGLRAARKLATNGISLLAGIEYRPDKLNGRLKNDCLVSLTTRWPGYFGSVMLLQPKFEPAHGESAQIKKYSLGRKKLAVPKKTEAVPIVFGHRNFCFSVLICSDLTNISHRRDLRGSVDALFALEWNTDVKTFSSLVESSALDLHAFVIQANNRCYGDSRIRSPAAKDYDRDIVQLKGGVSDYHVLGEIDVEALRRAQLGNAKEKKLFKPTPIGFQMSEERAKGLAK